MLDFLLITLVICIITVWIQSRPFFWRGKGIPWIVPLPILGNTGKSFIKQWPFFWKDFYSDVGDEKLLGFHYFSNPSILVKDLELCKKVTIKDADYFTGREMFVGEVDPLGRSLFFSSGQRWKNQRIKMTPYFTPSRIKAMVQFLHPVTDRFVQYIADESKKGPVDVQSSSFKLSTDAILTNAFGLKPEAFDDPNSFFYNLQKELVSVQVLIKVLIGMLSPSLHRMFGLTFFRQGTINKLTTFINDVTLQRSKGIGVRPDFLQGMLELMQKNEIRNVDATSVKTNDVEDFDKITMAGQCMLMYTAGTETTGNSLSFVLYELAANQEIQSRLRDEINQMMKRTSGNYELDDLNSLTYLNMVVSEALRKYPIVVQIGRKCTRPYNLDGLDIPVGTLMLISVIGIHHDPNIYPDPMKFDPERFAPETSSIPQGAYLPFGLGPRTCIGMKFALVEISMALVKLVSKYKFSLSSKSQGPMVYSSNPTLSSSAPIWLDFETVQTTEPVESQ